MKKQNHTNSKGVTLVALIITIVVIIIIASIATYSGIDIIRSSRLTSFTTEMKIMQTEVNELYEKWKNGEIIIDDNGNVTIQEDESTQVSIGKDLTYDSDVENQASYVLIHQLDLGDTLSDLKAYRYFDYATIEYLGIEGTEGEFFVNIADRKVVSFEGFRYDGVMYYTLEQLPQSLYNVDYNPNQGKPTFDLSYEAIGDSKWRITVSNIQYDGNIDKWYVKYQEDGTDYWNTSEDLNFVVNKDALYNIYIENGDVVSDIKNKALGVKEPTPEDSSVTELQEMKYGVIEVEFLSGTSYSVTSNPNAPILNSEQGMQAVYWAKDESGDIDTTNITNNTYEISTDTSNFNSNNWYSYTAQTGNTEESGSSRWANAKVTKDGVASYFVWIPRYAYRIIYFDTPEHEQQYRDGGITEREALTNGWIVGYSDARGIVDAEGKKPTSVSSQTAISVNDKYFKTHPVFDGDVNYGGWAEDDGTPVKLSGFWIMKYEASQVSDTTIPKSEPGVSSWRNITIEDMFTYAKDYNTNINSHMMKNSEWGAVAYLTDSKYGRNGTVVTINNNSNYLTGNGGDSVSAIGSSNTNAYNTSKGMLASSTGNIYGIYDLSGGGWEYVASYLRTSNVSNSDSFINNTSTAYSTAYIGESVKNDYKYGDATYETYNRYKNENIFVSINSPFFVRGGRFADATKTGIFYFHRQNGAGYTYGTLRVCLILQ